MERIGRQRYENLTSSLMMRSFLLLPCYVRTKISDIVYDFTVQHEDWLSINLKNIFSLLTVLGVTHWYTKKKSRGL